MLAEGSSAAIPSAPDSESQMNYVEVTAEPAPCSVDIVTEVASVWPGHVAIRSPSALNQVVSLVSRK